MKLIDNWKDVLTKAWSVKFGMLGGLFYVVNALIDLGGVLPYLQDYLPPKTFLVLALVCALAGFISRFFKQPDLHPKEDGDGTA
jgi:hypothetical protein